MNSIIMKKSNILIIFGLIDRILPNTEITNLNKYLTKID